MLRRPQIDRQLNNLSEGLRISAEAQQHLGESPSTRLQRISDIARPAFRAAFGLDMLNELLDEREASKLHDALSPYDNAQYANLTPEQVQIRTAHGQSTIIYPFK